MNKKKKSTNTFPYPDEVIDRLARAFYPAILACWNSEEGQREFAAWQTEQAHLAGKEKQGSSRWGTSCCTYRYCLWLLAGCVRVLGIRKTVSRNDTATACQDWLRVPARPRKHQVPCPHRQGIGYGTFCISGTCTPLERCNTLDFVAKLCARVLRPLESLLTSPVGDVDSPHRKLSQKAHPAVCGEEKALLRKCNNPL